MNTDILICNVFYWNFFCEFLFLFNKKLSPTPTESVTLLQMYTPNRFHFWMFWKFNVLLGVLNFTQTPP